MIYIIFVILIIIIFILPSINKKPKQQKIFEYSTQKLMSIPEQQLYFSLYNALPDMHIFAQVGLSRIIKTRNNKDRSGFLRIAQKSVDYVICTKDMRVIAVIELDDSTHKQQNRIKADLTKDEALKSAGIPIIRWNITNKPNQNDIKELINNLITIG